MSGLLPLEGSMAVVEVLCEASADSLSERPAAKTKKHMIEVLHNNIAVVYCYKLFIFALFIVWHCLLQTKLEEKLPLNIL